MYVALFVFVHVCVHACVCVCMCASVYTNTDTLFVFSIADGSDYTGLSTSLTLQPGEDKVFINISTIDDQLLEERETFYVHLMTSDPAVVLSSVNRTVVIIDNDSQ